MTNVYYILAICVALVSLIATAVTVGVAWGTISQRQKSHEERDTERFSEVTSMLTEIRNDIKTILTTN